MPEVPEAPHHAASSGNPITKKIGPLPAWGWGVVGIAVVILFLRYRSASAANQGQQQAQQQQQQTGGQGYGPSLSDQLGTLVQDLQEVQAVNQELGQMQGAAQPIASTPPGPSNIYNYFGSGANPGDQGGGGGSSPFAGGPYTPIGQYPDYPGGLPSGSGGAILSGGNYAPVQPGYAKQTGGNPLPSLAQGPGLGAQAPSPPGFNPHSIP